MLDPDRPPQPPRSRCSTTTKSSPKCSRAHESPRQVWYTSRGHERDVSTFSPNASGVGADAGEPLIARTPLALRLNVSHQAA